MQDLGDVSVWVEAWIRFVNKQCFDLSIDGLDSKAQVFLLWAIALVCRFMI